MYAQLEIYLPTGEETYLALYKNKADANPKNPEYPGPLMIIDLTNAQLTELVVVQKLPVVNMNQ